MEGKTIAPADTKKATFWGKYLGGPVIITLFASLFYLLGDSFHRGYLKAFNIPGDLFRLSFQETVLSGFTAFVILGFKIVPAAAIFVISVMGAAVIRDWAVSSKWFGKTAAQTGEANMPGAKKTTLFNWVGKLSLYFIVIVITALGIVKAASYAAGVTSDKGRQDMKEYDAAANPHGAKNQTYVAVITYENQSQAPVVGYVVTASDNYVALYSSHHVTIIPKERIKDIVISDMNRENN